MLDKPHCRRLSFRTENNNPFYVEMNLEQTEFIRLRPVNGDSEVDIQEKVNQAIEGNETSKSPKKSSEDEVDIDAIMAEFS
jgi:hypothetical protein